MICIGTFCLDDCRVHVEHHEPRTRLGLLAVGLGVAILPRLVYLLLDEGRVHVEHHEPLGAAAHRR